MLVIGTAGHIDHGKSSIVKRLTNTDPDRLPEEKARGMTIDLGFAFYQTPSADTIAFVDVPGHERFVKNMVAGVGGIDVVMLVIAADDGWMPQSEEHFQIVRLLNIKNGIIVINKSDLADNDWLELLEAEVAEKTAGSFLENAPIFKISAQTGAGFDELREYLDKLPETIKSQRNIGKPRLYIDRSFVRPGIGGVVTGTLRGGEYSIGQTVKIFPLMKEAKIRSLHSNNMDVETAVPGQRTAISFTGIDKEYLHRGGVILDNKDYSYITENKVLALSVELLPNATVPLEDRRRMLFIVGTTEIEGEVRMYESKRLNPGDKGLIFFKPDHPVFALIGDHWIGRLPTPMVTVGGGEVLDFINHFPRKKEIENYQYLSNRTPITLEKLIFSELEKEVIIPKNNVLPIANFSQKAVDNQIKTLNQKKELQIFEGNIYFEACLEKALGKFKKKLSDYLEDKSHIKGLLFEQIVDITSLKPSKIEILLKYLLSTGGVVKSKDQYNLTGRDMSLKGEVKNNYDAIIKELSQNRYTPPSLMNLVKLGKQSKEAIRFMLDTSQVYKCGTEFLFLVEVWEEMVSFIKETINRNGQLTVSDLKDRFGLSRKYTIPILEETDRIKLTLRKEDVRVKGDNFEN